MQTLRAGYPALFSVEVLAVERGYRTLIFMLVVLSSHVHAADYQTEQEAWNACEAWTWSDPFTCEFYDEILPWRIVAYGENRAQLSWWTFSSEGACPYGRDEAGCLSAPSQTPEQCRSQGKFYELGQCVTGCLTGTSIDIYCNLNPETGCEVDGAGYVGTFGFGASYSPFCDSSVCPAGHVYAISNNQQVCIAEAANPPGCTDSALVIEADGLGFSCYPFVESVQPSETDTSDGDSDGDGVVDDKGQSQQLEDIKGKLDLNNERTLDLENTLKDGLQDLEDAIKDIPGGGVVNGTGQTEIVGEDGNAISWSGDSLNLQLTDPTDEYNQVMAEYQQAMANIRIQIASTFGTQLSGGGTIADDIHEIKGVQVNFSLNRFLDGFNILGAIVMFCAAVIAAGILFTGRG